MELQQLWDDIASGKLLSATLSSPKEKRAAQVLKINIRPVVIKRTGNYQITELHSDNKAIHRNCAYGACVEYLKSMLPHYRQGVFSTVEAEIHVLAAKDGSMKLLSKGPKRKCLPLVDHNRQKNYVIVEGTPVAFLVALGVMTSEGKVVASKYDKFRQVNKFLEVVSSVAGKFSGSKPLKIVDFGCGKAYLTFALHHYFTVVLGRPVEIIGLDLKQDVIERCSQLAEALHLKGIRFEVGDIQHADVKGGVDFVIALHACDTATDAALERAVAWDAKVIFCAPCCQHELYAQLKSDALDTLLRHGILRERLAALATDAIRADWLETMGYETQIMEFIALEHTPKNLLIRAVKSHSAKREEAARGRQKRFKEALGFTHYTERYSKIGNLTRRRSEFEQDSVDAETAQLE